MQQRQQVTIADIAAQAGVSTATVSYVLNNKPGKSISPDTVARVMEAAQALQYTPRGRVQHRSRSRNVGVVLEGVFSLPRNYIALQGVLDELRPAGRNACITDSLPDENGVPNYLTLYRTGAVCGIIYLGADGRKLDPQWENRIVAQNVPFVAYDCESGRHISSVDLDYLQGAYNLSSHILRQGAAQLCYIRPEVDTRQEREREQGVLRAAFEAGLEPQIEQVPMQVYGHILADNSAPLMEELFASILAPLPEDTGILLSWSGFVPSMLQVRTQLGRHNFLGAMAQANETPWLHERLWYSSLPARNLGRECVRSLLRLLDDPDDIDHKLLIPQIFPPAAE